MRRIARAALILALVGLVWAGEPMEFWVGVKGGAIKAKVRLYAQAPEKVREKVAEAIKEMLLSGKGPSFAQEKLKEQGISVSVTKEGEVYVVRVSDKSSDKEGFPIKVGIGSDKNTAQNIPNSHKMPDMLKKGLVQDPTQGLKPVNSQDWYPELPQQMAYSGGAIASEENSLAKKIKLTDTQFKQLWNQIIEANKKIDVKEANGVSVNGVEGFVVNMDKVLNLAKEREFIIKGKEMKIGNSQWAVNACDKGMVILRKIKMDGEYYLLPPTISFLASLYDDALLDGKLNIYVFNKPMKNSRGEDINLDFAVLRLKDADEYGFSSASERFDLYMLSIGGGSLHVYVEVPKGYEVVGVMPEIVKTNGKLKDGEVVKIYIRGMYLALKDKETGKRVLFYVGVAEGKYGITVSFALAQPNR